jgi:hypothetical protein
VKGSDRKETDRYYQAYQRLVVLSLLFVACAGSLFLADILGYTGERASTVALILGALYLAGILGLKMNASGARRWGRHDPFFRAIFRDEWSGAARNRASRAALTVTLWVQVPLAIFMAKVPPAPSVVGMAALTISLGLAAFFGAYLYYGRQPSDG